MNSSELGRLPYPPVEPYASGHLEVDERHRIYWETAGNPQGVPVLFLHGGPGAGCIPAHRRFFDPAHFRIILFDQRGAGRSLPQAEIRANTTAHLLDDMERLREFLGVEQWLLFGGSWGSTLALAYGQAHARRCLGFVLRGIFLGTAGEIRWFLHDMKALRPEAWRDFCEFLPEGERGDLLAAYRNRLNSEDAEVHLPAAISWARYEARASTLLPNPEPVEGIEHYALALARIEAHYLAHDLFLDEGQLLRDVGAIRDLPAIIVQGRYDMVCPIAAADKLARAWPEAYYEVVPDAGHSAFEPGTLRALAGAVEAFKQLLPLAAEAAQEAAPKTQRPRRRGTPKSPPGAAKPEGGKVARPSSGAGGTENPLTREAGKSRRRGSRKKSKDAAAKAANPARQEM